MDSKVFTFFPAIVLYTLLVIAVLSDCKDRRIPNKLVLIGSIAGITLHTTIPSGDGFFSNPFGGLGFFLSLAGLGVGFLLFLPMYLMRAMGAGDVKLVGMIGAFFGPTAIVNIVFFILISGGVMAVATAAWNGTLIKVLNNIRYMTTHSFMRMLGGTAASIDAPPTGTGKLPYACAIATGTVAYVIARRTGAWTLLV